MTSRSRQDRQLRNDFEDPPIAATTEERTQNAMDDFEDPPIAATTEERTQNAMFYCQPPRNWPLRKAAQKAGISVWTLRR
jgi:hypothetical protein